MRKSRKQISSGYSRRLGFEGLERRELLSITPGALTEISDLVDVTFGRLGYDRRTGELVGQAWVSNMADQSLPSNLYLAFDGLEAAGVSVSQPEATAEDGTPLYKVDLSDMGIASGSSTEAGFEPGETSEMEVLRFSNPNNVRFNLQARVLAEYEVDEEGGTILGTGGIKAVVPSGSLPTGTQIGIEALSEDELLSGAPAGFSFAGAVTVDMGDTEALDNIELVIPKPEGLSAGDEIYLAQIVEYSGIQMYHVVDSASILGDEVITNDPPFPGVVGSGSYCFFYCSSPVGWVGGQVTQNGTPVQGAVATLSGGYFLDITDGSGNYGLPGWPGNFVVVGFNPSDGATGQTASYMSSYGQSVQVNVTLQTSSGGSHDMLENGSFESGLSDWVTEGEAQALTSLGPIHPVDGTSMAFISSGGSALGGASSSIEQTFDIPLGATELTLSYNFVSEEYYEWVGSAYNDAMTITLHTPAGPINVAFEDVNNAAWQGVSGINFPGGDSTTGQTGWQTVSVDVSALQGQEVKLVATVHDVGDTIYDSAVLVDGVDVESTPSDEIVITQMTTGSANDECVADGLLMFCGNAVHESKVSVSEGYGQFLAYAFGADFGAVATGGSCWAEVTLGADFELAEGGVVTVSADCTLNGMVNTSAGLVDFEVYLVVDGEEHRVYTTSESSEFAGVDAAFNSDFVLGSGWHDVRVKFYGSATAVGEGNLAACNFSDHYGEDFYVSVDTITVARN